MEASGNSSRQSILLKTHHTNSGWGASTYASASDSFSVDSVDFLWASFGHLSSVFLSIISETATFQAEFLKAPSPLAPHHSHMNLVFAWLQYVATVCCSIFNILYTILRLWLAARVGSLPRRPLYTWRSFQIASKGNKKGFDMCFDHSVQQEKPSYVNVRQDRSSSNQSDLERL